MTTNASPASPRTLNLLCFLNRSGSTFIANQLSRSGSVCVCPEGGRFLSDLARLHLKGGGYSIEALKQELLSRLRSDPKLSSWGLDHDQVRIAISGATEPFEVVEILSNLYADKYKPTASTVVIQGAFLPFLSRNTVFGHYTPKNRVRALIVTRDPRAIFSSQKTSVSSGTKRPMQNSIIIFVFRYRQFYRWLGELDPRTQVIMLSYESWILDVEGELRKALEMMGCDPRKHMHTVGDLQNHIPKEQIHLHPNIFNPPDPRRLGAWMSQLNCWERWLLARLLPRSAVDPTKPSPQFRCCLKDPLALLKLIARELAAVFRKIFRINTEISLGRAEK